MLPSNPELQQLKRQARQLEIQLFDPRELPQWGEWTSWWYQKYGQKIPFEDVIYHAPELTHRPTFRSVFPGLPYGKPVDTEQFLVYRLLHRYADDTYRIRPLGHSRDSGVPEAGTPRGGRTDCRPPILPRARKTPHRGEEP